MINKSLKLQSNKTSSKAISVSNYRDEIAEDLNYNNENEEFSINIVDNESNTKSKKDNSKANDSVEITDTSKNII